jgi:signal transduction histidine kinase
VLPAPKPVRPLVRRLEAWSHALALFSCALGALVFAGWLADSPTLERVLHGQFVRQLSSGAGFLLVGASLLLRRSERLGARGPLVSALLGAAAALIGGFILVEDASGWQPLTALGQSAGARMEPDTAVAFVLAGLALACIASSRDRLVRVGQTLAGLCALVALAALFGHAYSVKAFFGVTAYTKMSLGAVAGFLAVAVASWFARPDAGFMALVSSDGAAGFAARRLYPAVILLPLCLGMLTLAGEEARLYNGKFGLSVLVLASIVVLVMLVVWFSGALDRSDHARMRLAAVLLEESERRHLARELHDEIGQSLTALKVRLEMMQGDANVVEARAVAEELMARVSSLSLDLRPAMLDDLGLLPALLWLLDRYRAQTGINVEFSHDGLEAARLPRERETAAFRIVQEALSNAARHSGSARVAVRVQRRDDRLSVQVEDGGRGFDPKLVLAEPSTGGLIGMRERAVALGGKLTVEAAEGGGTRVAAELPAE